MPKATRGGGRGEVTADTYGAFREAARDGVYVLLHKMDGCVYCQMAQPAWDEAVRRCGRGARVGAMRYDPAWVPQEAADVRGFPTIRAYRDGRAIREYQGDRSADSILEFVRAAGAAGAGAKASGGAAKKPVAAGAKKPSAAGGAKRKAAGAKRGGA